ncbi:beta-1,3-galactosyltransferase brn-like [Mytilus californianus]|uniref:beta-1,3-galactosyltransferase brn-like n=1 Tax=Mytilus californianus TaxID=6549 RepID=UPI0022473D1A|nr:beta-1,3-galactosyltransferase brn-like [Mytilus californianus]
MKERGRIEIILSYIVPRRRLVIPILLLMGVAILIFARATGEMPSRKTRSVPEFEEYTYESLLSTFHNVTQINPHKYHYIHSPIKICKANGNSEDPELLILVKSDVTHFSYRMGIRSTWGNFSINSFKLVFLLGYSSTIEALVQSENDKYHDLVQENFVDAYRNNTIKTIMAFNWAVRTCPGTKYVLFVDDDYFVNVNSVTEFLKVNATLESDLFVGFRVDNARVFRYIESQWYMTKPEYPFLHYPPYISGGAMLLSMKTAMILQNSLAYVRYLYVDDVYIGIVAYLLNINLTHSDRFVLTFASDNLDSCLAAHNYGSPDSLIQEWKIFLRRHYDYTVHIYSQQMKDILYIK